MKEESWVMGVKKNRYKNNTKNEIIEAALLLFHANGYDGTSIRDIAAKAQTNPANIAYYFKNKAGLLEYCFIHYLEGYIRIIEAELDYLESGSAAPDQCLLSIMAGLLDFQNEHLLAARFVTREMSLDTTLNREVLTTYMAKESYYLRYVIERGISEGRLQKVHIPTFILQIKGLLNAPVFNVQYASELLYIPANDPYFQEQYKDQCIQLVSSFIQQKKLMPIL
ncbi:forespore capture DNA-binding protein RefZ [Bacillus testis]|uniref:forespore capture DNA-binding protein RefZ n=1 Tax=Bacillus testis TaxID=1622072 RepID=UPI00067F143F|nr:forespore capture DNA-binding protein RefZ [Bacillus testis]